MQPIPTTINKNGYTYLLISSKIKDNKAVVIYQQLELKDHYEVGIIEYLPTRTVFGKEVVEHWGFFSNEDFGKTAKSISGKNRAFEIANTYEYRLGITP